MADALKLYTAFGLLDDEYEEYIQENIYLTMISCLLTKQKISRIVNFAEVIVPQFSDENFRLHFRISREMFQEILNRVGPSLLSVHGGGTEQTDPRKQLLVFMCYISNQESMREISLHFGISISTVHAVIKGTGKAINDKFSNVIQWPDVAEQQQIAAGFQHPRGLPGIIGALDGTHIRLSSAPGGDGDYFNRKSFPSMQLQVVVDNSLLIRHAFTGWPGSAHDARVLRNSSLPENAEQAAYFDQGNYIIADSAYPLKPWLITPFKDNGRLNALQKRFNRTLSGARQVVERSIGHLKGRFRRLREVTVHNPEDIVTTIISGCILHNLCIIQQDNIEEYIELDNDAHPNVYPNIFRDRPDGIERRRQLMQNLA